MVSLKKLSLFMVCLLVSGAAWGAIDEKDRLTIAKISIAVHEGDHKTVHAMLKAGFPVNYCDNFEMSLIDWAAAKLFQCEHIDQPTESNRKHAIRSAFTVIRLLQAKADVTRQTPYGFSAEDSLMKSSVLKDIVIFAEWASDFAEALTQINADDCVEGLENCGVQ